MHSDSLAPWQKHHRFLASDHGANARRTAIVLVLTVVMMVGEIVAGTVFGSMALQADGWHMASHAAALGVAAFAYIYAQRHADSDVYTFGTGKVGDLAAFASALLLLMIAGLMAVESVQRLLDPVEIAYGDAIFVAALGLVVNLVSAWLLAGEHNHAHHGHNHGHDQAHDHGSAHDHDHDEHAHHEQEHADHHRDHNMRAAYVHILMDALTSVLAIVALVIGLVWGLVWVDALMGIVGAGIILQWSLSLMASTGRVLLDAAPSGATTEAVRRAIEAESDNRIADLHVWRVGPGHLAAVVTVVTHAARSPGHYKTLLANVPNLSHVTVEVERCCDEKPHAA